MTWGRRRVAVRSRGQHRGYRGPLLQVERASPKGATWGCRRSFKPPVAATACTRILRPSPSLGPGARGALFGLTVATTRDDITRAVYEGISFAIRHCFEAVNARVDEVRLSGGGARSRLWSQMLADVTGFAMAVPAGSQFGAQGAAIAAGVGIGTYASYDEAVARCVRVERRYEPDHGTHAIYDDRFGAYLDLIGGLRPYWPRLG